MFREILRKLVPQGKPANDRPEMLDPVEFKILSGWRDTQPFEVLAFGHPLSPAERKALRTSISKALEKASSTPERIRRRFDLAVIEAGENAKGEAYQHIGAALEAATKGSGDDMFSFFTLYWPLMSFLVRHTEDSDPSPSVILGVLLRFLHECWQGSGDRVMRDHAHLTFGAFKVMQSLELARLIQSGPGDAEHDRMVQLARKEAREIDQGTQGVFALGGWVEMRIEELET